MNKKLLELAKRREQLVAQAEKQRTELAEVVEVWRPAFSLADQAVKVMQLVREHPVITLGLSAILLKVVRPSLIGKWFSRGWFVSQILRKLMH
jgi:uncharacterized membrane protein YdfJ with MMPL/SSD domain